MSSSIIHQHFYTVASNVSIYAEGYIVLVFLFVHSFVRTSFHRFSGI